MIPLYALILLSYFYFAENQEEIWPSHITQVTILTKQQSNDTYKDVTPKFKYTSCWSIKDGQLELSLSPILYG